MARYDIYGHLNNEYPHLKGDNYNNGHIDYMRGGDKLVLHDVTFDLGDNGDFFTKTGRIYDGDNVLVRNGTDGEYAVVRYTVRGTSHWADVRVYRRPRSYKPYNWNLKDMNNIDPKTRHRIVLRMDGLTEDVETTVSASSVDAYFELWANGTSSSKRKTTSFTQDDNTSAFLYVHAPNDYGQSSKITVKCGNLTESFYIRTRTYPTVEQKITFPVKSGAVRLTDVRKFFGYEGSYGNLKEYVRGGGLVPSIADNAHIPTSPPIRLSSFKGTASALYFIYKPTDKSDYQYVANSGKTCRIVYNIQRDYTVGYGTLAKDLEYRYKLVRQDNDRDYPVNFEGSSVTNSIDSGWSTGRRDVTIKYTARRREERQMYGTLQIRVRNAKDHSIEISKTVNWALYTYHFG